MCHVKAQAMHILMVTPSPPQTEPTNAVPLVTHAQLSGLRERHTVTLLTVAGPDPAELEAVHELRAAGIEVYAVQRSEPVGWQRWQRRVRLAGGLLRGRYPFRTIWYWERDVQRWLDRLLAEQRFDWVVVEDNAMGVYRYRTTVPVVFTEHEVRRPRPINWAGWRIVGWRTWAWNELDWQRWRRYQQQVWRRFDRIQVFTARDAAALAMIAPALAERVRVNPFGIDLPPAAALDVEEPNSIVFVGGFSHLPNVDAACWLGQTIMPLLRRRYPGVRLTLVGSYPPPEVQALQGDDIVVTGRVARVEPFLAAAAVVVAPLRIGGGMRMKVLQSMAVGKAVVTTRLGGEGLTMMGCPPPLVIADSAEAFALAVGELLDAPPQRHELGRRAREFVAEHYSAQAYARRAEAVFAELQSEDRVA